MNNLAEARSKAESLVPAAYLLPSMLAVNTIALFALDRLGEIPSWLKTAAALFLAF
ncbi:MAG TPA: hypothetical protein VGS96_09915 [Thermoanaerobaculia bacterium]|jgi:hypothetical protein|nr:hypothetical protein [Thermoanaerobaculia bacterium]